LLYSHHSQTNLEKIPAQFAALNPQLTGSQPIDFRYAATASTPAVVHIKSIIKAAPVAQNNRRRDPMQDFFGDNFLNISMGKTLINKEIK
jgi:hypothetical protein